MKKTYLFQEKWIETFWTSIKVSYESDNKWHRRSYWEPESLKIAKFISAEDVIDENGPWDSDKIKKDYTLEHVPLAVAMDTSLRLRKGSISARQ